MSEGKLRAWVVTLLRFEHHEVDGSTMRRHDEVDRLDGNLPPAAVAEMLERRYARLYQPRWDEASGKVDERATMNGDVICVGHEPQMQARLVEAGGHESFLRR